MNKHLMNTLHNDFSQNFLARMSRDSTRRLTSRAKLFFFFHFFFTARNRTNKMSTVPERCYQNMCKSHQSLTAMGSVKKKKKMYSLLSFQTCHYDWHTGHIIQARTCWHSSFYMASSTKENKKMQIKEISRKFKSSQNGSHWLSINIQVYMIHVRKWKLLNMN